jgi:hypothetical protein
MLTGSVAQISSNITDLVVNLAEYSDGPQYYSKRNHNRPGYRSRHSYYGSASEPAPHYRAQKRYRDGRSRNRYYNSGHHESSFDTSCAMVYEYNHGGAYECHNRNQQNVEIVHDHIHLAENVRMLEETHTVHDLIDFSDDSVTSNNIQMDTTSQEPQLIGQQCCNLPGRGTGLSRDIIHTNIHIHDMLDLEKHRLAEATDQVYISCDK